MAPRPVGGRSAELGANQSPLRRDHMRAYLSRLSTARTDRDLRLDDAVASAPGGGGAEARGDHACDVAQPKP
jgi:hypothetical protein